jgi:hypothetical protein
VRIGCVDVDVDVDWSAEFLVHFGPLGVGFPSLFENPLLSPFQRSNIPETLLKVQ